MNKVGRPNLPPDENTPVLRRARIDAGLSIDELAERSGVPRRSVLTYDAGQHEPSVSRAIALADALGKTVEELFRK